MVRSNCKIDENWKRKLRKKGRKKKLGDMEREKEIPYLRGNLVIFIFRVMIY